MLAPRRRRLHYEAIELESTASFNLREVRGTHYPFRWHHHPEIEIVLVLKGAGRRYVGDSIEDFAEGDLCVLGPGLPHTWHTRPAKGASVHALVVQFQPNAFGERLWSAPEMRPIAKLLRAADRGLHIAGRGRDEAAARMVAMFARPAGSWRRMADLIELLGLLGDGDAAALCLKPPRPPVDARASRRIDAVFALLDRGLDRLPTQGEAAATAGLTPSAFSRFFRRCLGRTWVSYLNQLRIASVCRDLLETDRSITDIAYASGFNNLANFNRRFRALTGTTPLAYRRACRQAEAQS